MQEKKSKRKQNIWLLVTIGAALILVGFIQFYFYKNLDEVNSEITELVDKYNKNCPLTIQEGIRLDSVSLPEKQVAQYNLTLVNVVKETAEVDVIKQEIEKSLISTAKANPGLQVFRDNDFTLVYSYNDKKKVFLFKVTIMPDQYK
ncbi:hypothetical protein [Flavobacterium sp. 1355]|uniref:hypothetical protein n=1 Tax=Flavobacterium sp. 1355 TaxID=2806571 RepID=UPI001AE7F8C6|nr:hypothetical protein [Flavobacterium sp. 1355]MBP1223388.1 flagellar basal body-associated protein FliL [Flavobacterium sp. 1355]